VFRIKNVRVREREKTFLLLRESPLLNNNLIKTQLDLSPLNHLLLNGVVSDKAIYDHLLELSNAVSTILGLKINLRIPINENKSENEIRS
jgi:hypothetical protein